jgi:MFS transporter, OFA family, oxalate/formate antiporter
MDFKQKRWFYLGLSVVIAICSGIGYTWSVFQGPLIEHFQWDLTTTSLIFTVQVAMSTLTPIVVGRYQSHLGTRNYLFIGALVYGFGLLGAGFAFNFISFFLVFSVGVGVGIGMLYPCLMGYGVRLIPEKKGLATGMLAGSYGAGAILWAPIAIYLKELYGILSVYKIFGVGFMIIIVLLVMMLRDPDTKYLAETSAKTHKNRSSSGIERNWHEMIHTPRFYMLLGLFAIGTSSGLMIIGHASAILVENLNITATNAAYLVGMMSISNALGPIVWGAISDSLGRYRVLTLLFCIVGLSMLTLFCTHNHAIFIGAIMTTGFAYGGFAALIAPATADVFGSRHVNVNYGFLYISFGLGGVIGPQIAAFTKDIRGDYSLGFLIISLFCIIGIGLAYFVFKPEKAVATVKSEAY